MAANPKSARQSKQQAPAGPGYHKANHVKASAHDTGRSPNRGQARGSDRMTY